jgi:hypothetical protein
LCKRDPGYFYSLQVRRRGNGDIDNIWKGKKKILVKHIEADVDLVVATGNYPVEFGLHASELRGKGVWDMALRNCPLEQR